MKKILGLIGAFGLTTSTIATGVAATPVQTIKDVKTNSNEIESFVSVSPFGKIHINARNCGILKDWGRHWKWKWAVDSGYDYYHAEFIADISYDNLYEGWRSNRGITIFI